MSLNPAQIYLIYLRVTSYTIAPLCENKGDLNQDQSRAGLGLGWLSLPAAHPGLPQTGRHLPRLSNRKVFSTSPPQHGGERVFLLSNGPANERPSRPSQRRAISPRTPCSLQWLFLYHSSSQLALVAGKEQSSSFSGLAHGFAIVCMSWRTILCSSWLNSFLLVK